MKRYTVCFIQRGDQLLMLNRVKSPYMGLWNGVGGKIEKGETPEEGAIREIYEETGLKIEKVREGGTLIWKGHEAEGMGYVYFAEIPNDADYSTPVLTTEGILDWKDIDWVLDPNNIGVVHDIPIYLSEMFYGKGKQEITFIYRHNQLISFEMKHCS